MHCVDANECCLTLHVETQELSVSVGKLDLNLAIAWDGELSSLRAILDVEDNDSTF